MENWTWQKTWKLYEEVERLNTDGHTRRSRESNKFSTGTRRRQNSVLWTALRAPRNSQSFELTTRLPTTQHFHLRGTSFIGCAVKLLQSHKLNLIFPPFLSHTITQSQRYPVDTEYNVKEIHESMYWERTFIVNCAYVRTSKTRYERSEYMCMGYSYQDRVCATGVATACLIALVESINQLAYLQHTNDRR